MKSPLKLNLTKLLFVLFIITPSFTFSQNNGDSLKFEIIKETVSFLAIDKATFTNSSGKKLSCKYPNYNCLEIYINKQDLKGVNGKLNAWKSETSSSKEDLNKLVRNIIYEITTGSPKKQNRTKFKEFNPFKTKLNTIAEAFKASKASSEENSTKLSSDSESKDTSISNTDDQLSSANDQIGFENNSVDVNNNDSLSDNQGIDSGSSLTLISFILSLLAFGLSVYLLLTRKRKSSNNNKINKFDNHIYPDTLDPLKQSIKNQKADLDKISDYLKNMDSSILQLQNRIKVLEVLSEKKVDNEESSVYTRKVENTLKYARYPNKSNGFTNDVLKDSQNGEMIYEIELQGNHAQFYISSNPSAQNFALTDIKNYLGDACDFINQPSKGCEIHTKTKGTLTKSDGIWIIQNKSTIEFK